MERLRPFLVFWGIWTDLPGGPDHQLTGETEMAQAAKSAQALEQQWAEDPRWNGIERGYSAEDVVRLRGSVPVEHSLARMGAEKLWKRIVEDDYVNALGAMTGNQAMQMAKAGLKAIYLSGWQVAADANNAGTMYPDQSLYPADSVPAVVRNINNALQRADQITHAEGNDETDWFPPIMADAEAGFGGVLNAFELMKAMIDAGASGVHFEDQLASAKKCGHMGGKVLIPTQEAVQKLIAARLAADISDAPTLVLARTDSLGAALLTSDIDPRDRGFTTGERTVEGFFKVRAGMDQAIARGLAYAPYADLVWCETGTPDSRPSQTLCRGYPREVSRQDAGLQLFAVLQLETPPGRRHHRKIPARAGCHGLQISVHHPRWLSCAELLDVRFGGQLPRPGYVGLCRASGAGVWRGESWLYGDQTPAGSRRWLFRQYHSGYLRRNVVNYRPWWLHRGRAVS